MKKAAAIATVAVVALYFYKSQPFPWAGKIATPKATTEQLDTAQNDQATRLFDGTSAPRSTSIVVAPMPKLGWKTGPYAQTDLVSTINRLKTGPNAQTDLTMKRSW